MRNRLHALSPYFSMFPETFVEAYVNAYTVEGDHVFDPFSGRGTTIFQSLLMGRVAAACDINPVAFCISSAKAEAPALDAVLSEIDRLESYYLACYPGALENELQALPSFFRRAFYPSTLRQLLFLRHLLDWNQKSVHCFIAALILGSLHGEMDKSNSYFSNQMPRTISPKPAYSLRYWRARSLWAQKRDVFHILRSKARFRLSSKLPAQEGLVCLGDARNASSLFPSLTKKIKAVITSPPYFNMTSAEEDQWLRLWFLGNDPRPTYGHISKDDRHTSRSSYWKFLTEVWEGIAPLLVPEAVLVCRLGGKDMNEQEMTTGLYESLSAVFPHLCLLTAPRQSAIRNRQTDAFRPGSSGCLFEIDYVFGLAS